MSHNLLSCTLCHTALPLSHAQTGSLAACPRCGTQQRILAFPAALKEAAAPGYGEPVIHAEEASCFYHEDKRAEVPCEICGRFLCGLCQVHFRGKQVCPSCLEGGLKSGRFGDTQYTYPAYDSMALSVAIIPVIVFPIIIFTAPIALIYGVRALRMKRLPVVNSRLRAVIAITIACLQLAVVLYVAANMAIGLLEMP